MKTISWALGLGAILSACSSSTDPGMARNADASVGDPDAGAVVQEIQFEVEDIDGVGVGAPRVGDNATLALDPAGKIGIAYGSVPLGSTSYEIWYATRGDDGAWTKERAILPGAHEPAATGQIIGLGFTYVGGVPTLVYLGGDGDGVPTSPFPSDLMLAQRGGGTWTERTLSDTSADGVGDCPGTQNTCNAGNVTGSHASIAANPAGNGFAVVYRDTHFGFGRNDLALSDVEVYAEGGPTMHVAVDPVRGGGAYGNVTYTQGGNLVLAYNLETPGGGEPRVGVWAAAWDGTTWTLTKVADSLSLSKIALATAPDGTVWMAFNHADDVKLVVASSTDGGKTWTSETVDDDGKTGLYPALAFDAMGRTIVTYGYCGRFTDDKCPGELIGRSTVKMARREGTTWKKYLVDDGQGLGYVGFFTSAVVTADGKLGVAFVNGKNGSLHFAKER